MYGISGNVRALGEGFKVLGEMRFTPDTLVGEMMNKIFGADKIGKVATDFGLKAVIEPFKSKAPCL